MNEEKILKLIPKLKMLSEENSNLVYKATESCIAVQTLEKMTDVSSMLNQLTGLNNGKKIS